MDLTEEKVLQIINEEGRNKDDLMKKKDNKHNSLSSLSSISPGPRKESKAPLITKLQLDKMVNIDLAIKLAQSRMWRSLKVKSDFDISMEQTQNVLKNYSDSKTTFVILYIDIVDSTKLSMTLPVDRLATIIQGFSQEMSMIISAYGGYILKYIGDAILAFFIVDCPS